MPRFDEKGSWVEPTDQQAWSATKKWLAVFVALVVLGPVIGFGVKWITADARGAGAAREQIKANPNFRIAAYQEFFDLCSAVQAQEDRIAIFKDDTSLNGQTNLRAVEAKRAELIRDYNSKASRNYTEGQFRDSDLPYHIDPDPEATTTCTS